MRAAALLVVLAASPAAAQAPRAVTLADAVELALRTDPLMEEVAVDRDRARLGVLRAQLDRISFRVDGQLQELWNKGNIGGPPLRGTCTISGVSFPADEATCTMQGGTFVPTSDQGAQGLFNLAADLRVPLFTGFRIDATVKRAQRMEEAALVQVRRQRRDTALAVARAFWAVRRLELLREVQRASLQRTEDAERAAAGRFKAGLAPPIDRNRATSRKLQQQGTLAEYEGQIEDATAQLGVGLALAGPYRLEGEFSFPDAPPPDAESLLAIARRDRPELAAARLQIDIAHQGLRIARSGFYPTLGAVGLLQFGNNQFSLGTGARDVSQAANPFANVTGSLTVGATLNMNFFDMLRTYTTARDAQYEKARWIAEQRRVERAVAADVLSARAKVQRLYGRRAPLRAAVEVARDNARILEGRYRNGDALVIELLDAQLELAQAEGSLVDVEAQLELAWVELRAALGELPGRR